MDYDWSWQQTYCTYGPVLAPRILSRRGVPELVSLSFLGEKFVRVVVVAFCKMGFEFDCVCWNKVFLPESSRDMESISFQCFFQYFCFCSVSAPVGYQAFRRIGWRSVAAWCYSDMATAGSCLSSSRILPDVSVTRSRLHRSSILVASTTPNFLNNKGERLHVFAGSI